MRDYIITTDADSELPYEIAEQYGIKVFEMPFTLEGVEYLYDLGKNVKIPDIFEKLAKGAEFSTSCRPPWEVKEFFAKFLEEGKDILYIGLCHTMSNHINNCYMAAEELRREYPDAKIIIIDTMSIAVNQGQMAIKAAQMKNENKTIEETAKWIEDNKQHYVEYFIVDDLNYLKRGGRLSAAAAFFGTVLDIKPLLRCNDDGKLEPIEKIKGRKKALKRIAELIAEKGVDFETQKFVVAYSNLQEGEELSRIIKENTPVKNIELWPIGPVIGGHTGPGVIGVGFFGTFR